jgi:DNA-directed RNA polymerase subunit N (RpoN/RPB10)
LIVASFVFDEAGPLRPFFNILAEVVMKELTIKCSSCGEKFSKARKEYDRRVRLGKSDFFCSRSCAGKSAGNMQKLRMMSEESAKVFDISEYAGNKHDKYTGLRQFLNRAKQRDKHEGLTLEHLLEVWNRQGGRCAYTGVHLERPKGGRSGMNKNYLASLDRIDSNLGYRNGNVQFVSVTVNNLKNDMTEEQVYEFFGIVKGICGRDLITA